MAGDAVDALRGVPEQDRIGDDSTDRKNILSILAHIVVPDIADPLQEGQRFTYTTKAAEGAALKALHKRLWHETSTRFASTGVQSSKSQSWLCRAAQLGSSD